MVCQDDLWHQRWPHTPRFQSGIFNIIQVWHQGWGIPDTLKNHARDLKFYTQVNYSMYCWSMMSRMISSSKTPVRKLHCPPSMTKITVVLHTFYHARELKFGTQVKNHTKWWSMMSKMTPYSKNPVGNLQHPPSITSTIWDSWNTSYHAKVQEILLFLHISYEK